MAYSMPEVNVGDVVLYYGSEGDSPAAALVTQVGAYAVSLTIFPLHSRNGLILDGVRHKSDPDRKNFATADFARCFWDYTKLHKLIMSVQ